MKIIELKTKLLELQKLKDQEIKNQNYERAAQIRDEERQCLEAIRKIEIGY